MQPAGGLVARAGQVAVPFAQTFSTAARSSASTGRLAGERSAATATEKASFGSFLPVSPACSSRTRAASLGGTSSTCSPAATSCCASRCPSPAAPSTAQVRSGQAAAHASSVSAWDGQACTCNSPSGSSAEPIATAVCEFLCGSIPIITSAISALQTVVTESRSAAGMPNSSAGARASFEPRRGGPGRLGTSF